jgi:hypothetical protein
MSATDAEAQNRLDPPVGIGIALSGGGIRAACLGLGALQAADRAGLLGLTNYVSGVSGGAYTASAFVASRALEDQSSVASHPAGRPSAHTTTRPWAQGSTEEQHLRQRLRYLGEDWSDVLVAGVHYLIGLLLNLLPFLCSVYLLFAGLGQVYRATDVLAVQGADLASDLFLLRLAMAAFVAVLAALIDRGLLLGRLSRAVRFGAACLVLVLLLPDALAVASMVIHRRGTTLLWIGVLAVAVSVLAFLVMRSQWAVQLTTPRLVGLRLVRAVFSIVSVALLLALATWTVMWSLTMPSSLRWTLGIGSVVVLLAFGIFIHANSTSLHGLYARRLDRAFVVRASPMEGQQQTVTRLGDVGFTSLARPGVPELLVCAAVNLTGRESAEGEGCGSFVFSSSTIGGRHVGEMPMASYQQQYPGARLDCSSVIAASGAAIAPNMGVFTRKSLRVLLALLNLRLGMWLPNPNDRWSAKASKSERRSGILGALTNGWHEPGPLSSWREALGNLSRDHRFVFVSDGGHWDNTGVVELLRRRCQVIFSMDAATDHRRLANLLRLVTLARVELGIELEVDGHLLESTDPVLRIPFRYPHGQPPDTTSYLIVMRTHIRADMPADLYALGTSSTPFPRHSTLNQFLRAQDVDAYLALGRWLCQQAISEADLPALAAASRVRDEPPSPAHLQVGSR